MEIGQIKCHNAHCSWDEIHPCFSINTPLIVPRSRLIDFDSTLSVFLVHFWKSRFSEIFTPLFLKRSFLYEVLTTQKKKFFMAMFAL